MFALVALLALYAGGNNIKKAFNLAATAGWGGMASVLLALGVVLLLVGFACVWQAMRDLETKKKEDAQKAEKEKNERQRQFFFDEYSGTDENGESL